MKTLFASLIFFFALAFSALAQCVPAQFAFSCLVPANGGICTVDPATSGYTWFRTSTLPYTVPADKYLGITGAHFGSKYINFSGKTRSSYLVIQNAFTVTELGSTATFGQPFIIPGGQSVTVQFFNNSAEAQWMNGAITGWISSDPLFRDCK